MKKKSVLALIIFIFLLASISISHAEIELKFGLYASEKPSTLKKMFDPVIDAIVPEITKRLGEPVKIIIKFSETYEGGIQDLVEGNVDFSRFGPASYLEAKKANPDVRILAIEAVDGKKTFNGIICVAKNSKIKSVADLKGKSFAFGNEQSTIGRFLSQQYLVENGIKASDLGKYDYVGNHQEVAIAVARGHYDAGALKESTYDKLVGKGADLRVIAEFPNVTKPWIARAGLSEKIMDAIKNSLFQLKDPAVLKGLQADGFLPGKDDDYARIRSSIDRNDDFFK